MEEDIDQVARERLAERLTASVSLANQTPSSIIKKRLGISFSWKKTPHLLEKLKRLS